MVATSTPATPARPMPMAKATLLTRWGLMPMRVAETMSSEAALTAIPMKVFLKKRTTTTGREDRHDESHKPGEGESQAHANRTTKRRSKPS